MKRYLAAVLLITVFGSIILSGCGKEVTAYTDSTQVIDAELNQEFTIALGSNLTTGYSWQSVYDASVLSLVKKEYKEGDTTGNQIVGSGGTEYFHFKTLKNGETTITFTYYRPWETPSTQDKTQVFIIDVKGEGK